METVYKNPLHTPLHPGVDEEQPQPTPVRPQECCRFRRARFALMSMALLGFALGLHCLGCGPAAQGPAFFSECLHPMGGGLVGPGGGFPPMNSSTVSEACLLQIHSYFEARGGQYWVDVERVSLLATQHFTALAIKQRPSPDQVIVFDIDETTLSNAVEWQATLESALQQRRQAAWQALWALVGLPGAEQAALRGAVPVLGKAPLTASDRPPLAPMLLLYHELYAAGYSVAFITGRKESARAATALNLQEAGYGSLCPEAQAAAAGQLVEAQAAAAGQLRGAARWVRTQEPCYVALHLREESDDRFASVYKPDRRHQLEEEGFEVVGNFGDQFSDLDGTTGAAHSFKLPNPAYLIL
eukprot:CAMPEP_0202890426 /NCGR_PEP_ID=MMETSP1392-20130828/829_1 /ASSEMBLY_ACC=CAM_ASM_000868 /TAXON_ID=225041 /ORGANISM="Chlamydomonas chlamydogama, Strain SAG 11-48b" /LENGTH=355 /DNA_ID=CAMNT_0049573987 /DNA_START=60 /DNA_END=1127 /DNA_ORIENTATION=+